MKSWRNLRASAKIASGFATVTCVLCAVGFLGVRGISQVNESLDNTAHRDLPALINTEHVDNLANLMSREIRQALLVPRDVQAIRDRVLKDDEELRTLLDVLFRQQTTDKGRSLIQDVRSAYDPIRVSSLAVIDKAASGDGAGGVAELERSKADKARLTAAIAAAAQRKRDRVERTLAEAAATYATALWTVIGAVVVGVLVGVAAFHAPREGDREAAQTRWRCTPSGGPRRLYAVARHRHEGRSRAPCPRGQSDDREREGRPSRGPASIWQPGWRFRRALVSVAGHLVRSAGASRESRGNGGESRGDLVDGEAKRRRCAAGGAACERSARCRREGRTGRRVRGCRDGSDHRLVQTHRRHHHESTRSRFRPICWRSTQPSRRLAQASRDAGSPSLPRKCARWPSAAPRRPRRSRG